MNKLLVRLALACSIAFPSLPAVAAVDQGTARSLMQDSGLWQTLEQAPAALVQGMKTGMGATGGMLPPALMQGMQAAAESSFTAERLQAGALVFMSQNLDAATVTEVRKWTSSALGQKVLALEKATQSDPGARRGADGQAELQKADEPRRKALSDIVEGTRAVDQATETSLVTSLAMMRGMASGNPAMAQALPSEEIMRGMLQGQLAGARQQMQAGLTASLAAAYASLSTAELQQYVAYLRSPAGAKMNELNFAAISAGLKDSATEFGRKLGDLMAKPAGTA